VSPEARFMGSDDSIPGIQDSQQLRYTVAFRPKVHGVSPVTSIVHWLRCSEVDQGRHRLGDCSFRQVTSWTVPMQAHACLRVLVLVKGDLHTYGVQEGTENY
jgi:hypothetical protein